jgi:RNA polymerase primary sigma factor
MRFEHPVWSRVEERERGQELVAARASGDAKALRRIEHAFVVHNLRLAYLVAVRFRGCGLPLDDLVQEGAMGLGRAAKDFDPSRGIRFATYATNWIQCAIRRAITNTSRTVRVPPYALLEANRVRKAHDRMRTVAGRQATADELSRLTGFRESALERASDARAVAHVKSLDEESEDLEHGSFDALVTRVPAATPDPETLVLAKERADAAQAALAGLPPRLAGVLRARMGDGERTLADVGGELGVSRERIRQLESEGLRALRGRHGGATAHKSTVRA